MSNRNAYFSGYSTPDVLPYLWIAVNYLPVGISRVICGPTAKCDHEQENFLPGRILIHVKIELGSGSFQFAALITRFAILIVKQRTKKRQNYLASQFIGQ